MNKILCYYASILCLMNVYQESSLILEEKLIDFLFQKKKSRLAEEFCWRPLKNVINIT